MNDATNTEGNRKAVITSDGDEHRRLRAPLVRELAPGAIKESRDDLKSMISRQVGTLVGNQPFDGVTKIAQHLPLAAISHLVGIPEDGRQNMLRWATATFNIMGPDMAKFEADGPVAMEIVQYVLNIDPQTLRKGSWGANLFDLVDKGGITEDEARGLLGDFMVPSLDTTVMAKANLLYNLGTNLDQWQKLKSDPSLIRSAVFEGVRHSAVVRWFSRVAAVDYVEGEVSIPKDARVMIIYGSANRDERQYPEPDSFQVDRNPRDQLGWGAGPHTCAGMHLAKMEMEVLLEALVEQVDTIEILDTTVGSNTSLYGLDSVHMKLN
jgi:cytochrome P450